MGQHTPCNGMDILLDTKFITFKHGHVTYSNTHNTKLTVSTFV